MAASAAPMTASAAWNFDSGKWSWTENGAEATGWRFIEGNWYYFDGNGDMATGWRYIGGKWYYMNQSGAMTTGWQNVGGVWYYMNPAGDMATGWKAIDGRWFHLGASGAMTTGWLQENGNWYYLDSWGPMATGWRLVNNTWYYMDSTGAMETGFYKVGDKTYFSSASGAMQTGVVEIDGDVYYFDQSGAMVTGKVEIDGKTYTFDENGAAVGRKPEADKAFDTSDTGAIIPTEPTDRPSGGSSSGGILPSRPDRPSQPDEPDEPEVPVETAPVISMPESASVEKVDALFETTENGMVKNFVETGLTSITSSVTKGTKDYSNVRFQVTVTNAEGIGEKDAIQLIAKDTNNNYWDVAELGFWGPAEGFALADASTAFYIVSDTAGQYTVKVDLVDLADNNKVLASDTGVITVTDNAPVDESKHVTNIDELNAALADETVTSITLDNNIEIPANFAISRAVTIDGDGNGFTFENALGTTEGVGDDGLRVAADGVTLKNLTVTVASAEDWQGNYAIQVHDAVGVTLENVTATGGDAGILVNGSSVIVDGTVDVSDNEFGGIEVSRGADLERAGQLTINGNIVMVNEEYTRPAVWSINRGGYVEVSETSNISMSVDAVDGNLDKIYYFVKDVLDEAAADDSVSADTSDMQRIELYRDIEHENPLTFDHAVELWGNNHNLAITKELGYREDGLCFTAAPVFVENISINVNTKSGWNGNYVIHTYGVYGTTSAHLTNVSLSGGDAGILVNGSMMFLAETINVSGNEFGGIEVSLGAAQDLQGHASLHVGNGVTIVYEKEDDTHPAVWIDRSNPGDIKVFWEGHGPKVIEDDKKEYYFANTDLLNSAVEATAEMAEIEAPEVTTLPAEIAE